MKNTLKITVSGVAATGKSAVAFAIKDMLYKAGIGAVITGDEDEDFSVMEKTWESRLNSLKGKYIHIETKQVRRTKLEI